MESFVLRLTSNPEACDKLPGSIMLWLFFILILDQAHFSKEIILLQAGKEKNFAWLSGGFPSR
jgi:hypothetical protein